MNTPDPPNASTAPTRMKQLATDFLNRRVADLANRLSLEVADRNRLQRLTRDLAAQQPTYVPKLHQIPIGIWNEVEDEQYTKQPDEPMAEFDAEVPIRSGKDSEAALMVLTKRRAEIRDARSVSSLRLLFTVYELAFRNGGIEESNVGKKTRKWERFPMLK